jgi:hypothetical protein
VIAPRPIPGRATGRRRALVARVVRVNARARTVVVLCPYCRGEHTHFIGPHPLTYREARCAAATLHRAYYWLDLR